MKKEYAIQKIKPVLFAAVFILVVVLILSACPNTAGTNPSTQGLIIEGTVLKGYRGEKPTGVLEIPDGITEIAKDAFKQCTGLTQVKFPASLTAIRENAFIGCMGLTELNLPVKLTTVENYAFYGCTKLTSLTVDSANMHLCAIGNIVYNKAETQLLCSIPILSSASLNLSEGLEEITPLVFRNCTGLTQVKFPSSLKKIGYAAFRGCSGVSEFDFSSCTKPPLNSIGNGAFADCTAATYKVQSGSPIRNLLLNSHSGITLSQITEVP